jgi:hypothetical protein
MKVEIKMNDSEDAVDPHKIGTPLIPSTQIGQSDDVKNESSRSEHHDSW